MRVTHKRYDQLNRDQIKRLIELQDTIWPKEEQISKPLESRIDAYLEHPPEQLEVFLLEDGDTLLAHAEIFGRRISTTAGDLKVMALASVCSPEDRRGEGFGKLIVQEAFKQVDGGRWSLSLFQTGVPKFYQKLGARIIENAFLNSRAEDGVDHAPWWNPYQMIYPGSFTNWPDGTIDLLGPGY